MKGRTGFFSGGVVALLLAAIMLVAAPAAGAQTVFSQNWDSGTSFDRIGWSAAPAPTQAGDPTWQILQNPQQHSVDPGINPALVTLPDSGSLPPAHSGTNAVWFGDTSSGTFCGADWAAYNAGASKNGCTSRAPFSQSLTSPSFPLTGAQSATLHFFSWWEIESVNADQFDLMKVDYSTDGGQTWSTAPMRLNPASNPAGTHDQSYSNNGLEVSPSWHEYLVDLTPAVGSPTVQIRFTFDTVDAAYNGFRGWLIDDISVNTPSDAGTPTIDSVSTCQGNQDAPVTVLNGSHFLLGSQALVDGSAVPTSVVSSQRIEIPALSPGTHSLQVQSPNGGPSSNAVQATAGNCAPVTQSSSSSSTPPPSPPTGAPSSLVTAAPSALSSSGASFSGSVDPNGLPTSAYFQYSLDPKYSAEAGSLYDHSTASQPVGSGFGSVAVPRMSVSGLVPNALYHVRLVAVNADGTRFGPDVAFTTRRDPPPPPPVLGKWIDVSLVSGLVLIKAPPGKQLGPAGDRASAAALSKGVGFVPLTEARQIPTGSEIDARLGSLQVVSAAAVRHGKLQRGTFAGGLYKLSQLKTGISKGLTTLSMLEDVFRGAPSYASCPRATTDLGASAAALSARVLQTLRGNAHGRFRTSGRYAAATVRGTNWATVDRCDGTLTLVHRGTVAVSDFIRHVTVLVHAGRQYLARAPATKKKKK